MRDLNPYLVELTFDSSEYFLSSLGNAALNQNKYDFKLLIKIRIVYDEILII